MARWHITDSGEVKQCHALSRCPYEGVDRHFNNPEAANHMAKSFNSSFDEDESDGIFSTVSRKSDGRILRDSSGRWNDQIEPNSELDGDPREWEEYLNSFRYGFGVQIPPGYEAFPGIYDLKGNPVCVMPPSKDRNVVIDGKNVVVKRITPQEWKLPFDKLKKKLRNAWIG